MTFSVSRDEGALEWAGTNLFTVFCQPGRLLDPGRWRLIWDVMRFNACAGSLLAGDREEGVGSIGEYLDREGYSDEFKDDYLIVCISFYLSLGPLILLIFMQPMTAAIWSTPPDKCFADLPARTLVRTPP